MISRRNFISITILMVAVLFLCMSINYLKDSLSDRLNDYSVNQYTETAENYPSKTSIYVPHSSKAGGSNDDPSPESNGEASVVPRNLVVCIGDENETSMKAAAEWVVYTKRNIAQYPTLTAYGAAGEKGELPELLVIDPDSMDWASDGELDLLDRCLENGTSLVFCGLPDASVITDSQRARELLGIKSVRSEETTVNGFYLREGFLLGGATFYLETAGEGSDELLPGSGAFPGERTFPWYLPVSGTKVYMRGVPKDDTVEAGEYPIVLWRNSRGNAFVFAVNGDFMDGQAGIGLLSAMSAEMHSYELYPVVNAQNVILAGYPCLANENSEVMDRLYNRSVKMVHQELMWPGISQLLKNYSYRATCMLAPQYDYSDNRLPDGKQLEYYLKIFAEQPAETGLYGLSRSNTSLSEKLEADGRFLQDALGGYDIASFYAGSLEEEQLTQVLGSGVLSSVKTAVMDYDETRTAPVGFLTENVTAQGAISDGLSYTYKSDFLVRSMETALGYLSVSCDLTEVAYPSDGESTWTQLSRDLGSIVTIYGQQYPDFSRTTAAECDVRIRQFLALDYSQSRTGDQIEVQLEAAEGSAWFILRTHNETVRAVDGGSWVKLEDGAYLIEVTQENATLTLGPADERHFQ